MRTINLKYVNNNNSFKYLIFISLHYYELTNNKERTKLLDQYLHKIYLFDY